MKSECKSARIPTNQYSSEDSAPNDLLLKLDRGPCMGDSFSPFISVVATVEFAFLSRKMKR